MRFPTLLLSSACLLGLLRAEDARLGPLKDLNGYFPTGGGFIPVNPQRMFDTR